MPNEVDGICTQEDAGKGIVQRRDTRDDTPAYMFEEERVVEVSLDCIQGIRSLIMISKIDLLTSHAWSRNPSVRNYQPSQTAVTERSDTNGGKANAPSPRT